MSPAVTVRRGSVYLSGEICERYLAGLAAVVLQRAGEDLLILPVRHAAAGGYLLKRRNARGDRVVGAVDFFRAQGLDDDLEHAAAANWDAAAAALRAGGVFRGVKAT